MHHQINARSISLVAIIFAALILAGATAASQKQPQRIQFERGKSSATIHGHVAGFDTQDYVVEARAGQQLDIHLKGSNAATYFVLYSINGKPTDMNETDHYSLATTESGDYVIRVFLMRSAALGCLSHQSARLNFASTVKADAESGSRSTRATVTLTRSLRDCGSIQRPT